MELEELDDHHGQESISESSATRLDRSLATSSSATRPEQSTATSSAATVPKKSLRIQAMDIPEDELVDYGDIDEDPVDLPPSPPEDLDQEYVLDPRDDFGRRIPGDAESIASIDPYDYEGLTNGWWLPQNTWCDGGDYDPENVMSHTITQQIYMVLPQLCTYAGLRIMASPGFDPRVNEVIDELLQKRIVVGNLPPDSRPYKRNVDWDRVAAKVGFWLNHPLQFMEFEAEIKDKHWDVLQQVRLLTPSRMLMNETANLKLTAQDRAQHRVREKEASLGRPSSSEEASQRLKPTDKVVRLDSLTPQNVRLFNVQLRRFIDLNYDMSQVLELISEALRDSVLTNTFFTMGINYADAWQRSCTTLHRYLDQWLVANEGGSKDRSLTSDDDVVARCENMSTNRRPGGCHHVHQVERRVG